LTGLENTNIEDNEEDDELDDWEIDESITFLSEDDE
jgi:hypothetical protein